VSVLVDTSVVIDCLRGVPEAVDLLATSRAAGPLHASEVTRLEVLAGMRPKEEQATRRLLGAFQWHPVDMAVAELGGELGRAWLRSHSGIDTADLAVAATAMILGADLLTPNVRHFPMFPGLDAPC
jgi:predicted nucleic acid-binding protein